LNPNDLSGPPPFGSNDVFAIAIPVSKPAAETTYGNRISQAHLLIEYTAVVVTLGMKRGIDSVADGFCGCGLWPLV